MRRLGDSKNPQNRNHSGSSSPTDHILPTLSQRASSPQRVEPPGRHQIADHLNEAQSHLNSQKSSLTEPSPVLQWR